MSQVYPPIDERSPTDERSPIDERILRETLRQVADSYDNYNLQLFGGKLKRPLLEWSDASRMLGSWNSAGRTLRLSTTLVTRSWGEVIEVLKHEMAHQFVDECLGGEPTAHGVRFQQVCADRGIDARAAGEPQVDSEASEPQRDKVLDRIQKLLALAASDNQHEAEVATATAQRLMLKHNLEQVGQRQRQNYTFVHLGTPTGRRMAWQRVLASILSEYFFVEIIIMPVYRPLEGKRGSVLEACGTPENLEIASYVHDFLERSAMQMWRAHKKRHRIRRDKKKQSYLRGVMCGFRDKLASQRKHSKEQGLVWLGDPELQRYYRRRHPYTRSVHGRASFDPGAFSAGHSAGRQIVLHRGVQDGHSGGGPRLLPGRR